MQGTIKTIVAEKGFGFIAREGQAKDLFFHSNDVTGASFSDLKVGDVVSFEVVDGQKGPNAKNVTRVYIASASAELLRQMPRCKAGHFSLFGQALQAVEVAAERRCI